MPSSYLHADNLSPFAISRFFRTIWEFSFAVYAVSQHCDYDKSINADIAINVFWNISRHPRTNLICYVKRTVAIEWQKINKSSFRANVFIRSATPMIHDKLITASREGIAVISVT
jgi:hypothetical protein